jgi:CubicO group peptidase (beta-lactamase class C family)
MDRRRFLTTVSTVPLLSLTGCVGAPRTAPSNKNEESDSDENLITDGKNTERKETPIQGESVEALSMLDEMMLVEMDSLSSSAATLAVAADGQEVFYRTYGYREQCGSDGPRLKTTPESLFRIASLTKPMTRAATVNLLAETAIDAETKVFERLGLEPLDEVADERIYDITVEHCLEHRLGWDHSESGDPLFEQDAIRREHNLAQSPTAEEIVRAWLDVPLDFKPGKRESYSNLGYILLELLIESESGSEYIQYLHDRVLEPIGIVRRNVQAARQFPSDRPDREVNYQGWGHYGEFDVESMTGTAGLVSTAGAYLRFLMKYNVDTGEERPIGSNRRTEFNLLKTASGYFERSLTTYAFQLPEGIDAVAFFNSTNDSRQSAYNTLLRTIGNVESETWREVRH